MKIVPYKRERDYLPMMSVFDNFVNRFFIEDTTDENQRIMAIDIIEHDDNYSIEANLPGFTKKDIKIAVEENELIIEAQHEEKKEEKKGSYCRCERYKGNYRRVLTLSDHIDKDNIEAKYEDGVLKINIQKIEAKPAKEIRIG
jgi:HSP20 family protein